MAERRPHKPVGDGPIPSATTKLSFCLVGSTGQSTGLRSRGVGVRISHEVPVFLGVAHLVERVLWEHEARGSSPLTETILTLDR